MRYSEVLFDLYGTLVPPFRMREHKAVVRECADILGVDFEECHDLMGQTLSPHTCCRPTKTIPTILGGESAGLGYMGWGLG